MRHKGQFLVDSCNAVRLSSMWAAEVDRLTLEPEGAIIFGIDSGQDLDQGGFSGAVFADQAQNLTRVYLKIYLLKCLHTWEVLGNLLDAQESLAFHNFRNRIESAGWIIQASVRVPLSRRECLPVGRETLPGTDVTVMGYRWSSSTLYTDRTFRRG